jgi:hypothetical protein
MDFGNQCGDRALGIVLESKGNYLSRRMRMRAVWALKRSLS